ncbi:MAG TPA: FxLYD domain-containing protein [Bacillota bacterium]|nr:FxLYD domain-containing protein [Bacillota bacterium]
MKKNIAGIIAGIITGVILTMSAVAFGAERPVKIILDGREIHSDVPPQIINDRAFVPIRVISEALGIDVRWDEASRSVILTSPENMPEFGVVSYNKVDKEYGFVILGEVKNQSKKTFKKVEVKAKVIDSGGNVIDSLSTTLPAGITPGETAFFRLRSFSDKGYLYDRANFSFSVSDEVDVTPADVVFTDVRFSRDPDIYNDSLYVTGEVERTDEDLEREYKHPVAQVALFDENGRMVNFGEKSIEDFELGRSREFKIKLENGPAYSSYKLKFFSD